jgi:hypothetical protein
MLGLRKSSYRQEEQLEAKLYERADDRLHNCLGLKNTYENSRELKLLGDFIIREEYKVILDELGTSEMIKESKLETSTTPNRSKSGTE